VQKPVFAEPPTTLNELPVHYGDLSGRPAKRNKTKLEPKTEGFGKRYATLFRAGLSTLHFLPSNPDELIVSGVVVSENSLSEIDANSLSGGTIPPAKNDRDSEKRCTEKNHQYPDKRKRLHKK